MKELELAAAAINAEPDRRPSDQGDNLAAEIRQALGDMAAFRVSARPAQTCEQIFSLRTNSAAMNAKLTRLAT